MGSRTVVFDVRDFRPNMEREEMAQTFFDQFKDEHVISAIQIVPGGVCKVTFESAGVKQDLCSRDICNVGGVDCCVLNHAKRVTSVQVHHYPFENDLDPLFKVLSPFGEVKRTRFQHWTNIPEINTGTILLDVILNHHIPRTLKVGKLRVKVWYRDQPLCCDICQGPHRVTDCDLRGKCRRCGEEGHFLVSLVKHLPCLPPRNRHPPWPAKILWTEVEIAPRNCRMPYFVCKILDTICK